MIQKLLRNQFGIKNPYYKHGFAKTRLYRIWSLMKQRCNNQEHVAYKYYGGRGIIICNEWLEFIPFRDWALNNGYADNLEIDRIDNNSNYKPANCQWITHEKNAQNRGTTKLNIQLANEIRELYKTNKYTMRDLAKIFNMDSSNICKIINNKKWKN